MKVIVFIFLCLTIQPALAQISPDIPLADPIYGNVNRLSGRGFIRDDLASIRPITESRLATITRHLETEVDRLDPQALNDLKALQNYVQAKMPAAGAEIHGGVWGTNAESSLILETAASVNPLLEGREGKFREGGVGGWIEPRIAFRWQEWGALDLEPFLPLQYDADNGDTDFSPTLRRAALALGHGAFEVKVGRIPLRWGHGFSGTLLMGGSHTPLDQIQIQNTEPVVLPWVLKHLGPIQFVFLVARLDDDREFPNSYIVGERIAIRPAAFLELGFTQAINMGGDGAPDLNFSDTISEVMGRRLQDVNSVNLSNRNFSGDFRLSAPPLRNAALYGEFYVEDCCPNLSRDIAELVGIELPDLWSGHQGSFGLEMVRTTEITYRNGVFTSGFEEDGHLLGHPLGPDAIGVYARYGHCLSQDLEGEFRFAFERRGRNEKRQGGGDIRSLYPSFEQPEERFRLEGNTTWNLNPTAWLRGNVGLERIEHFKFISRDNRWAGLASVDFGYRF